MEFIRSLFWVVASVFVLIGIVDVNNTREFDDGFETVGVVVDHEEHRSWLIRTERHAVIEYTDELGEVRRSELATGGPQEMGGPMRIYYRLGDPTAEVRAADQFDKKLQRLALTIGIILGVVLLSVVKDLDLEGDHDSAWAYSD